MRLSPTGSSLSSPWFLLLVLFIAFFVSAIHLTPRGADLSSRNSENFYMLSAAPKAPAYLPSGSA